MPRRVVARRLLFTLLLLGATWGGYALYWYEPRPPAVTAPKYSPSKDALPANEQWAELCRTDVLAALDAGLSRYAREVTSYRTILHKQERLSGVLHQPEEVQVVIASAPLRIRMNWSKGARPDRLGTPTVGALYVEGANNNQTRVWRQGGLISMVSVGVKDSDARRASRYTIVESAFDKTMLRTLVAWREAQQRGEPKPIFVGTRAVPELNGRVCHEVRRDCAKPEIDSFALDEQPSQDPSKLRNDGHSQVTIFLDAENWLQVGSVLKRADGELTASYFFRDLELNPTLPADTFTETTLKRR